MHTFHLVVLLIIFNPIKPLGGQICWFGYDPKYKQYYTIVESWAFMGKLFLITFKQINIFPFTIL